MPPASAPSPDLFRGGLVGMYALALMAREGPTHGYRVAESVAEKTGGSWRPGPGAIYPTLQRLVTRGFARSRQVGPRRVYEITPAGRVLLRRLRSPRGRLARGRPDYAMLWAEVIGVQDFGEFLHRRLRRDLEGLERYLQAAGPDGPALASQVGGELREAADRLERAAPSPAGRPAAMVS